MNSQWPQRCHSWSRRARASCPWWRHRTASVSWPARRCPRGDRSPSQRTTFEWDFNWNILGFRFRFELDFGDFTHRNLQTDGQTDWKLYTITLTRRPSAARPRSRQRPSTVVSMLPPHSRVTTLKEGNKFKFSTFSFRFALDLIRPNCIYPWHMHMLYVIL